MAQRPRRELLRSRSSHSRAMMDVPHSHSSPSVLLDAWWRVAQSLVRASGHALSQVQTRPRVETAVKCSGGVVAALLALKYAKSLRSACVVGLVSGVFAHSLYADVIRKKPLLEQAEEDGGEDSSSDESSESVTEIKDADASAGGAGRSQRATR